MPVLDLDTAMALDDRLGDGKAETGMAAEILFRLML